MKAMRRIVKTIKYWRIHRSMADDLGGAELFAHWYLLRASNVYPGAV